MASARRSDIDRTFINTWQDKNVVDVVKKSGRKKIVMAALWWLAVASEWQRDWAREATATALGEVLTHHAGGSGVALGWELQLLGQPRG